MTEAVFMHSHIFICVFACQTSGTSGFAVLVPRAFKKYSIHVWAILWTTLRKQIFQAKNHKGEWEGGGEGGEGPIVNFSQILKFGRNSEI